MSEAWAFGVISDVQYADADDGMDKKGKMLRYYRGTLDVLANAVTFFNQQTSPALTCVYQLGDLIDGQNARDGKSEAALASVLGAIGRSSISFVHLVGNHDLYNFDRDMLAARLGTRLPNRAVEFYASAPAPGWRVVVLDAFQEAVIGWPATEPRRETAVNFLRAKRTECGRPADADPDDWFAGLEGEHRRFNPYNGAFGARQLSWLSSQILAATDAGDRLIILSHVVLHPEACHGTTMAWDYEAALEAIGAPPGVVAAVVCGHEHKGGYHRDEGGVHHLTLQSPLNEGASGSAFGVVRVLHDRLEVESPSLRSLIKEADLAKALDAGGSTSGNLLTLPLVKTTSAV